MKGFKKASDPMNRSLKAVAVDNFSQIFAAVFGNPFVWPLATFGHPFMTTLAAHGK
jgi:hypothetical protein